MDRLAALASVAFLTVCQLLLDSASAQGVDAVNNTSDCISAINLARSGSLKQQVPQLSGDPALAEEAIEDLKRDGFVYVDARTENTCRTNPGANPASVGGLLLVANSTEKPNADAIAALIHDQITKGLAQIGDDWSAKFDVTVDAYMGKPAAQNLAYLLFSGSKSVGCAAASNCSAGKSVVVCKFKPTLQSEDVPFTKELLDALKARQNAGVNYLRLNLASLNTSSPSPSEKNTEQDAATEPSNLTEPNNPESSEDPKSSEASESPCGSAILSAGGVLLSLLFLADPQ